MQQSDYRAEASRPCDPIRVDAPVRQKPELRELERARHRQRHVRRREQQPERVRLVRPVPRVCRPNGCCNEEKAAAEERQQDRHECHPWTIGKRAGEPPHGQDEQRPRDDLGKPLQHFEWQTDERCHFAKADVQREHERGLMRLGGECVVNEPARLFGSLPHGRFVLRKIVDEPGGAEPRGVGRRAARRQQQWQLPDHERARDEAEWPAAHRSLRTKTRSSWLRHTVAGVVHARR
jgi:hypothetical protein